MLLALLLHPSFAHLSGKQIAPAPRRQGQMGGWGLTSCPHPPGEEGDLCHPGQLQHGHHGPDHVMSTLAN